MNSVLNLPDVQVRLFEEFKLRKELCNQSCFIIKTFLGLVEMNFGLVNAIHSLPKWQAVKLTFFAPCMRSEKIPSGCLGQVDLPTAHVAFHILGKGICKSSLHN